MGIGGVEREVNENIRMGKEMKEKEGKGKRKE